VSTPIVDLRSASQTGATLSINDRFCQAPDGTRIAYAVDGEGPAFVLTNGLTTTTTFWDHLRPLWLRSHRVVTWDLPGHGNSEPARTALGARIESMPAIVERVMAAAGIERATQIGWSSGCQVVFELYRQRPERCAALAALLGPAGRVLSTAQLPLGRDALYALLRYTPEVLFAPVFLAMMKSADTDRAVEIGKRARLIGRNTIHADARRFLAHLQTLHPITVQRMAASAEEHSAHDVLPHIEVPVLVVAGDRDPYAPSARVGLPLHHAIPGSELLRLPRGTHTALLDHAPVIAERVEQFARLGFNRIALRPARR
jgi:pimeloyl-ACP methyl ester carboxylesterase